MLLSKSLGFSTLELLIASTILISAVVSSTTVVFTIQNLQINSSKANEALNILSSTIAQTSDFVSPLPEDSTEAVGDFTLFKKYKSLSRWAYEESFNISWQSLNNKIHSIASQIVVTDYKHGVGADTCNLYLNGLEANPHEVFNLALPNNGNITDIDVSGEFVYVSVDDSVSANPDLYILKINFDHSLLQVASLNTGPGISAITIARNNLFVANTSTTAQLQVINISNPIAPSLLKSYKLPNISGTNATGNSIYYLDNKIYLGTAKTTGPEFNIIDVQNSSSPQLLGSFETDTQINNIIVDKNFAYLTTPNQQQLRVINVSNIASPNLVSSFSDSGYQVQDGKALDVLNKNVYFGRTVGGFNNPANHELYNLEKQSNNNLSKLSSKDLAASARAILYRSGFLFVGTNDPAKEWQEWEIDQNQNLNLVHSLDLSSNVVAFDCQDDYFYLALEQSKVIILTHAP